MTGTRTHSDVDFYEQLGVSRNASPEEIRHAYRSLVRLLHPDSQTDPELKGAAEKQLRKLNRIHAILIDPVTRRNYDEHLAGEWTQPILVHEPNVHLRKNVLRGVWIAVGLLTVAVVFWLGSESSPSPEIPSANLPVANTKAPVASKADDVATLRAELDRAVAERDEALREVARLQSGKRPVAARPTSSPDTAASAQSKQAQPVYPPIPALTETPAPSAASPQVAGNSKTDTPASKKLAGFWSYVPPHAGQQNKNRALYPPEFIEMSIQEDNGNVKGKYRARYKILDRPISPDVNFELAGRDVNGNCACTWHGIGGAHGLITLQLSTDHKMRFDWVATELGSQQGLASGTATLTRRSE